MANLHSLQFVAARRSVLLPTALTAAGAVSAIIDCKGVHNITFVATHAAFSQADIDAGAVLQLVVEHGDEADGSDMEAVPDQYLLTSPKADLEAAGQDANTHQITAMAYKRHMRLRAKVPANLGTAANVWAIAEPFVGDLPPGSAANYTSGYGVQA